MQTSRGVGGSQVLARPLEARAGHCDRHCAKSLANEMALSLLPYRGLPTLPCATSRALRRVRKVELVMNDTSQHKKPRVHSDVAC